MSYLALDILVPIRAAVAAAVFGAVITYFLRENRAILPGRRESSRVGYRHLVGDWYSYHVTVDHSRSPAKYWQEGEVRLEISKGVFTKGIQTDYNDARDRYALKGEIRNAQLFLLAEPYNDTADAYVAHCRPSAIMGQERG